MPASESAVRFQKLKFEIHQRIVETLDLSRLNTWKPDRLRLEVRSLAEHMTSAAPKNLISDADRPRMIEDLMDEVFGLGPLEPLMRDPTISDILVNGPRTIYIERNGKLEMTDIIFADDQHVMMVIQRIAARIGRRADEMAPMVDARLPDGSRVNAIVPPVSLLGPVLSIRRFGVHLKPNDLLRNSTMTPEMMELLRACVEARISILISGGTGSGKTTLLNALSRFIPSDERLVTIEDSAELKLQQSHVIQLETKMANAEGSGEIKQRDLVRNALRMRPDRIIVGEVRGGEALDMLQAMNTGHEGSLTTIHANDTRDALTRLEMMVMMAGFELPIPVIRYYTASAISLVIQLARMKGGARRVVKISEIAGLDPPPYNVRDLFGYRQQGIRHGEAYGEFYATGQVPAFLDRLRWSGIELDESLFAARVLTARE